MWVISCRKRRWASLYTIVEADGGEDSICGLEVWNVWREEEEDEEGEDTEEEEEEDKKRTKIETRKR